MHEISTIRRIINTYTETTQIPIMYIDNLRTLPSEWSENYNYAPVLEYGDFDEVTEYLEKLFVQTGEKIIDICTFRTKTYLVYLIAVVNNGSLSRGAYVAGPLLPYSSEKRITEEIMTNKALPLHRKTKFEALIRTLPFVSEERLSCLARLLQVLCQSAEKSWYIEIQEAGNTDPVNLFINSSINSNFRSSSEDNEHHILYSFTLKIKEKISQGNMAGIIDLLNSHSKLFWTNNSSDDSLNSLKHKCIVLCSISSVFAIQANAPYKRIMNLVENFADNTINMKSPQEIILKTAYYIETFAYLVSISSGSSYSLHIKRVMQYIKENYKEKITLSKLAEYVNLNSVYLSSLIKRETGLSLLDNVNLIRVEEGKNLLIFTKKSIQEISCILGYNYQNHFNNVFKKFTCMTPLEFRQNYGRSSFEP